MLRRTVLVGISLLTFASTPERAASYTYPVKVTDSAGSNPVCNGTADDTQTIINAITASKGGSATQGGTVLFPAGTCVVSASVQAIVLNNVTLLGAEVPHFSDGSKTHPEEAGTTIYIGTSTTPPGSFTPFFLQHSVTIRGINFVYPYQILQSAPRNDQPLFADDGTTGVSNILFDNVHVIAATSFWIQQGGSPPVTYGNIRFVNTDVYAVRKVFDWSNVQESVVFDNFISNPSLCSGGFTACSSALQQFTKDNGIWFHVGAPGGTAYPTTVGGIQANNLTVASYQTGILIDSNGHLDEALFGSSTVFDSVPYVLNVNNNGSITHTVFSGKSEFSGSTGSTVSYAGVAAFTLNNPQHPINPSINDHNTLSLNGFTADGIAGPLLYAKVTTGDLGSITLTGVVARHYCNGGSATDAVTISAPAAAVVIVGSQLTTNVSGCGAINVTATPTQITGNIAGYYPNN